MNLLVDEILATNCERQVAGINIEYKYVGVNSEVIFFLYQKVFMCIPV